ncbi:bleomycin resistance protein [Glycomyces sp. L485]|uniref:VOC family protein n=1 Tax=Glycomyces sp. L485 TaxID=2909235 RepID=UPI001F4B312F|nr:VOC family protein [Glycomyces sp. L485]MCH7232243.1 bleomycin resistance protein [Glycomyces sp. L485]
MTALPPVPTGSNTVNPFIVADGAADLIDFLIEVLGAEEVPEARTLDTDGLILHAELRVGDSLLSIADRKPAWPFTPALTRVYVDDVEAVLARAERLGARIVTRPTDFFGDTLARFQDPAANLWWVYRHHPDAAPEWSDDASERQAEGDSDWSAFSTPELEYVHSTLTEAMGSLRDPRI